MLDTEKLDARKIITDITVKASILKRFQFCMTYVISFNGMFAFDAY